MTLLENKNGSCYSRAESIETFQVVNMYLMKLKHLTVVVCVCGLFAPVLTRGQGQITTPLSNLGQPEWNVEDIDSSDPIGEGTAFTTGNSSVTLADIELLLLNDNNGAGTTLSVYLYSSNGGQPGSNLALLTGPAGGIGRSAYTDYTFTAPANTSLQADTTYWIVAMDSNPSDTGGYLWQATAPASGGSATADAGSDPAWSIGASDFYFNGSWSADSQYTQQFGVQIAAAPEPSVLAFGSLGVFSLCCVRRRK